MTAAKRLGRRLTSTPVLKQIFYRLPKGVSEVHVFHAAFGETGYPVCPQCRCTMEREYMSFCSRCGQRLDWKNYEFARITYVGQQEKRGRNYSIVQ